MNLVEENEVSFLGGSILLLFQRHLLILLRLVEFNVANLGAFFLFQNDYNCTMRQ